MFRIPLTEQALSTTETVLARSEDLTVTGRRYPTGVASVTVTSSRGHVEVLPFMGQMIWDVVFEGTSLRMDSMFEAPRPAEVIVDTYGCFAFHSGLLGNGCPTPEDTHPLHGEMACAPMDEAWLEVEDGRVTVAGRREYVQGFGHHYLAEPRVSLEAGRTWIDIDLTVTNLSRYAPMPLQYMCHMNHAWVDGARLSQSVGDVFTLRRTVPAHVTPTPDWTRLNQDLLEGTVDAQLLADGERYDPEIVLFADDLPQYGPEARFEMELPDGRRFVTVFDTDQLPCATRWLLNNPDQRVAAFALPATSRPEGRLAAQAAGTLIELEAGASRSFHVSTGLELQAGAT